MSAFFENPTPRPVMAVMLQHLEWLVAPARGAYDDALIEIAHDAAAQGDFSICQARLFNLNQIIAAASFAHERNVAGGNVYVGATHKAPDTPRSGRTSARDFYVATSIPVDIDERFEEAQERIRTVGKPEMAVFTGKVPGTRAQVWFRLAEPCDKADEYQKAQRALVEYVGADDAATGVARIMRLAGSVSYPNHNKQDRGYQVEVTRLKIYGQRPPVDIARLQSLAPPGEATADPPSREDAQPRGLGLPQEPSGYGEVALQGEAAKVASAPVGKRNDTLNTAAFRCGQLVAEGHLTADRVRAVLFEAAAKCDLVADDGPRAVRATIDSGIKAGMAKPRTTANAGAAEANDEEPAERQPVAFVELADDMLHPPGLVGEIVDFVVASARRPQRMLALLATLATLGSVMGRKYAGPTGSGTLLYVCGLAPTGAGKDHPPEALKILLHRAGLGHLVGPQEFMSLTAVYKRLSQQPQTVCFMDEFGAYLARLFGPRASGHEWGIKNALRTIWGRCWGTLEAPGHAEDKGLKPIKNAVLSIFGTSTAEEFYRALKAGDIFNGFLNRFLIGRTMIQPSDVNPMADRLQPPEQLVLALARLAERGRGLAASLADDLTPVVKVHWANGEAEAVYSAFAARCQGDNEHAELLSRAPEMAVRIATIIAVGRDLDAREPTVSVGDMEWARALVLWSAMQMIEDARDFMGETENQVRTQEVLRVIREAGEIARWKLTRRLQHRYSAQALDATLQGLEDARQINVIQSRSQKGRPGQVYIFRG